MDETKTREEKLELMRKVVARLACLVNWASQLAWMSGGEGEDQYYEGLFVEVSGELVDPLGQSGGTSIGLCVKSGCPSELYLTTVVPPWEDNSPEGVLRVLLVVPLGMFAYADIGTEEHFDFFYEPLARYADEHPEMWPKE